MTAPAAAPARTAPRPVWTGPRHTIRGEWVVRLQSGLYDWGRGVLRHGDAYCTLGVLADVLVEHGHAQWQAPASPHSAWALRSAGETHITALPEHLLALAGLSPKDAARIAYRNDFHWTRYPDGILD